MKNFLSKEFPSLIVRVLDQFDIHSLCLTFLYLLSDIIIFLMIPIITLPLFLKLPKQTCYPYTGIPETTIRWLPPGFSQLTFSDSDHTHRLNTPVFHCTWFHCAHPATHLSSTWSRSSSTASLQLHLSCLSLSSLFLLTMFFWFIFWKNFIQKYIGR